MDWRQIKSELKMQALEIFDEMAVDIARPNGITINEGMAATGLAYHCFYGVALQLNVLGKIKLIRSGGNVRLIAPNTPFPKEVQLFTSPANTADELREFLAGLHTGVRNGSVAPDDAQDIALAVGAQINQSLIAEAG